MSDKAKRYTIVMGLKKGELQDEVFKLDKEIQRLEAELSRALNLAERLKQEAQIHAGEARAHKSTVHQIYQLIGANKGCWNGSVPVRDFVQSILKERDDARGIAAALTASRREVVEVMREISSENADLRTALKSCNDTIRMQEREKDELRREVERLSEAQDKSLKEAAESDPALYMSFVTQEMLILYT